MSPVPSRRRHADGLEPRVRAAGARLEAVEVRADVVAGQVQHLAPEPPVLLDLCFRLRGAPGELAVLVAGLCDPAHGGLEARVLEVKMDTQPGAQIRVAVGDHVDALDRGDRFDVLEAFERLDRRADDDVGVGPRRVLGRVAGAVTLVAGVHPLPRDAAVADRRILGFPHDGARLLSVVHLRDLDAHDALIEDARDEMHERFVDAHDRRHARGLEPAGEIGDRLKIEGAVLVVDRAVIEAGRLDDPWDAARGELLEAGSERRPPFAHGPANAVLFHGSLQVCRCRTRDLADFADVTLGLRPLQLVVPLDQAIALLRRVENASDSHGPLNVAGCSLPPPAVRPMREYELWQWPSAR